MNFKSGAFATFITIILAPAALLAGAGDPPHVTDNYEISFGPRGNAIPGDPAFFLPINVSFSQPTVRIDLILTYDQTMLTPTLLAPNFFVQQFYYDLSHAGRIRLIIITDLPPPPVVPPIMGDTTVGWISFHVTSRFIGYDYLTLIDYFEDPGTPYGDNFIVLENNTRIAPPTLLLHRGEVVVKLPLYGDINTNALPWEIGDAVTFFNFLMGAPFTRQQYANADCNRDGVQASISDLVTLLRVITYDSLVAGQPPALFARPRGPEGTRPEANLLSISGQSCDIVVDSPAGLGGAIFALNLGDAVSIDEVYAYPEADGLELAYSVADGVLRIALVDWTGRAAPIPGGRLVGIRYTGDAPPAISSADFSDARGARIEASASLAFAGRGDIDLPKAPALALAGYPNPFNGAAVIRMSLPADGHYEVSVYDILGRRIKNLLNEYLTAGSNSIVWDGVDDSGAGVSSGTYFVRLKGDTGSSAIKLHLLK